MCWVVMWERDMWAGTGLRPSQGFFCFFLSILFLFYISFFLLNI
jgi:hypothetical protein